MSNTTNIALSTPAHGASVDTWDQDPVNNNSNILDACFGSVLSLSATSTTLGATNAQKAVLKFTGTIASNVTCTIASIIKTWTVLNNTSGNFNIVLSTGTGNAIGVPPGEPIDVFSDGSSFYHKGLGPVGTYRDFGSSDTPGWISACTVPPFLKCNGSSFSGSTYPALAATLGTTTLPDLRGRSRFYLDDGSGRVTTTGSGIDGSTRFSAGGNQSSTLAAANVPQLAVTVTDPGHSHDVKYTPYYMTSGGVPVVGIISSAGTTTGSLGALNHTTGISATANTSSANTPVTIMPPAQISGICMIRAA